MGIRSHFQNKLACVLLCVIWILISCSSLPPLEGHSPTPTPTIGCTATITPAPTVKPTQTPQVCLVVIADEAVHLRVLPTKHSHALTWILNGEQMPGILLEDGWWFVMYNNQYGYIKAEYVKRCEE